MNLVIDLGNTSGKLAVIDGNTIVERDGKNTAKS